ncbi:response regulator transcription factor [Catenovulum maritimum]|uniref:Phosphate regulon transcriptional regulatory protein PhoB n=1 Tax=Catenovulum maritimum TaxID=1513271 RepID=A0A0J8GWL9_9ALTE|nr:response regulator transcription factor [Catenovulum maritimum]KMT65068.1 chemotaxis protein CheY [Catenovulum maritimum]
MTKKILLVEDNHDIANIISINLSMLDHKVQVFNDGAEAYRQLNQAYDLAILDIMLPGTDGLTLCKRLRKLQPDIPIIMLTAKSSELDIVTGLENGADDYLTKPFSVLELQARVKAHLRRTQQKQNEDTETKAVLSFDGLSIDANLYQVSLNNEQIETTAKEFELLYFLAQQPKRVFSREHLLDEIWGFRHEGSAHTVNSTVNRIRAKLEPDPANPKWLKTVWGVGYKFSG